MYSKMEELDRLGGSGTNVRSGTNEVVRLAVKAVPDGVVAGPAAPQQVRTGQERMVSV